MPTAVNASAPYGSQGWDSAFLTNGGTGFPERSVATNGSEEFPGALWLCHKKHDLRLGPDGNQIE